MSKFIIQHNTRPLSQGYYSKIVTRKLVTNETGAKSCTVWEQIVPPGGYIVPHYHTCEEVLTFLAGHVQITLGDEHYEVEANTTVFIQPQLIHHLSNQGHEPVHFIALLMSAKPEVIYPSGLPEPIVWENN